MRLLCPEACSQFLRNKLLGPPLVHIQQVIGIQHFFSGPAYHCLIQSDIARIRLYPKSGQLRNLGLYQPIKWVCRSLNNIYRARISQLTGKEKFWYTILTLFKGKFLRSRVR